MSMIPVLWILFVLLLGWNVVGAVLEGRRERREFENRDPDDTRFWGADEWAGWYARQREEAGE